MKSFNSWMHKKEKKYNFDDVLRLAKLGNIDKKELNKYEEKQLIDGINSEKEHSIGKFNVIGKNEDKILKIALAHLEEDKEYYSKLKNCVEKK
jgi:predicted HicB family RNase H-like nuclease